jgi:hypothetical protein
MRRFWHIVCSVCNNACGTLAGACVEDDVKDKKRLKTIMAAAFCLAAALGTWPAWKAMARGYPLAGVAPGERPVGAPKIMKPARGGAWEKKAYRGVSKPYPPSIVNMLRDQGGWYTPFLRRGLRGRYDLRKLHRD